MGMGPAFRLLDPPANEEGNKRRKNTDDKQSSPAVGISQREIHRSSQKEPYGPSRLENARRLGTLLFRPRFSHDGSACRPFTADAERGQKSGYRQVPPGFRQGSGAGEDGVNNDRGDEDLRPAESIGENAERNAADRPTDEENGKDDPAIPA